MSDELSLKSQYIVKKVIDIHKAHPEFLPTNQEVHWAFEDSAADRARLLYERFDDSIIRKAQSDIVSPSDPNLPKIVSGCARSCQAGNCSTRCQNAIRVFNMMRSGKPMDPIRGPQQSLGDKLKRGITNLSNNISGNRNSRLDALFSAIDNDIDSDIMRNPDSKAYGVNKALRNEMVEALYLDGQKYQEQLAAQNPLSPFSYIGATKMARQSMYGHGAAVSDMALAIRRNKNVGEVLGRLNAIAQRIDDNAGNIDSGTASEIARFMSETNNHIIGYDEKAKRLIKDKDFLKGYVDELQAQLSIYNEKVFNSTFRDGTPEAEREMMLALQDIPPGNLEAARIALEELGRKRMGDEYEVFFKNSVDAHLSKRGRKVIQSYGNRASKEERQFIVADTYKKSPYLRQRLQDYEADNEQLAALGLEARWDVRNFHRMPQEDQKDLAIGVARDLYAVDGEKGLANAVKYFGETLSDDMLKQVRDEGIRDKSKHEYSGIKDNGYYPGIAPTLASFKRNPDEFNKLSYEDQQTVRQRLEYEFDRIADRRGLEVNSPEYERAKQLVLSEFTPLTPQVRQAIIERNRNFAHEIVREDGMRMYVADMYRQPGEFFRNNKELATELMYDRNGQKNAFGEYMDGMMYSMRQGYAHPLLAHADMETVRQEMRAVIDSVPPQYREQIFSDRFRSFALADMGPRVEQDITRLQGAALEDYQNAARRYGIDPSDPSAYQRISDFTRKYAFQSDVNIRSPQDTLNFASQLENSLASDASLTEDQVDALAADIAAVRGNDHVIGLLAQRHAANRHPESDEGAMAGLYLPSDTIDKREMKYEAYINANWQYANKARPERARDYAGWHNYQLAVGGRRGARNVRNIKASTPPEQQFGKIGEYLGNTMFQLSQKLGRPISLGDLDSINSPELVQEAKEYQRTMLDMAKASNDPALKQQWSAVQSKQYGGAPAEAPPRSMFMSSEHVRDAIVNGTDVDVNNYNGVLSGAQFKDFYNGMMQGRRDLAARATPGSRQAARVEAINMFDEAVQRHSGGAWADSKKNITNDFVNGIRAKANVLGRLSPGQEISLADIAQDDPSIAAALDVLKMFNPQIYESVANQKYSLPKNLKSALKDGTLLSPKTNERYADAGERKRAREFLRDVSNQPEILAKLVGVDPNDAEKLNEYRTNLTNALSGFDYGVLSTDAFIKNPDTSNMTAMANALRQTVALDKMNASSGGLMTRYALDEMRNVMMEHGTAADQALFNSMSINDDGTFSLGGKERFPLEAIPVLAAAHRARVQASEASKSIRESASSVPTERNVANALSEGFHTGESTLLGPLFGDGPLVEASADPAARLSKLTQAASTIEASNITDMEKAYAKDAISNVQSMYADLQTHMAAGGTVEDFVAARSEAMLSDMAAQHGLESMTPEQVMSMGRVFANHGNTAKAMEFASAAAQLKEMSALTAPTEQAEVPTDEPIIEETTSEPETVIDEETIDPEPEAEPTVRRTPRSKGERRVRRQEEVRDQSVAPSEEPVEEVPEVVQEPEQTKEETVPESDSVPAKATVQNSKQTTSFDEMPVPDNTEAEPSPLTEEVADAPSTPDETIAQPSEGEAKLRTTGDKPKSRRGNYWERFETAKRKAEDANTPTEGAPPAEQELVETTQDDDSADTNVAQPPEGVEATAVEPASEPNTQAPVEADEQATAESESRTTGNAPKGLEFLNKLKGNKSASEEEKQAALKHAKATGEVWFKEGKKWIPLPINEDGQTFVDASTLDSDEAMNSIRLLQRRLNRYYGNGPISVIGQYILNDGENEIPMKVNSDGTLSPPEGMRVDEVQAMVDQQSGVGAWTVRPDPIRDNQRQQKSEPQPDMNRDEESASVERPSAITPQFPPPPKSGQSIRVGGVTGTVDEGGVVVLPANTTDQQIEEFIDYLDRQYGKYNVNVRREEPSAQPAPPASSLAPASVVAPPTPRVRAPPAGRDNRPTEVSMDARTFKGEVLEPQKWPTTRHNRGGMRFGFMGPNIGGIQYYANQNNEVDGGVMDEAEAINLWEQLNRSGPVHNLRFIQNVNGDNIEFLVTRDGVHQLTKTPEPEPTESAAEFVREAQPVKEFTPPTNGRVIDESALKVTNSKGGDASDRPRTWHRINHVRNGIKYNRPFTYGAKTMYADENGVVDVGFKSHEDAAKDQYRFDNDDAARGHSVRYLVREGDNIVEYVTTPATDLQGEERGAAPAKRV